MIHIEVTDTFAGEPNYSWVQRYQLDPSEDAPSLIRRVKKVIGWTGLRCIKTDYGDMIELRPRGMCQVCFVRFDT